MRHAVFLLTALAAIFAHSDEYEWYDPTGELPPEAIGSATITVGSESMSCGVLPNGELIASDTHSQQVFDSWEQKKGKDPSFAVAFNALQKSLTAETMSRNIAKRLDSLFGENRLTVDNGDGTSSTASITISDNGSGTASMSISGLTRGADPDGVTIEKKSDGKLGVIGVNAWNSPEIMYTMGGAIASAPLSDYTDGVSVGVKTTTAGGRQLEVNNWSSAPAYGTTMADALSGKNTPVQSFQFLARSSASAGPYYVRLGKLGDIGGGVNVDGESIVTNETADGSASIAGFVKAGVDTVLTKSNDGSVEWTKKVVGDGKTVSVDTDTGEASVIGVNDGDDECFVMSSDGEMYGVSPSEVADGYSIGINYYGKFEIDGWFDREHETETVADRITGDDIEDVGILARNFAGGDLMYIPIGTIRMPTFDGESIVTNETADGSASLAGFQTEASNGSIPFADGSSLKWTSLAQGGILEMKESSPRWTSTTGTDMYFGTAHNGGGMAWYPLPNVTTNAVEADGVTLKEINVASGRKQFAINDNVGDGVFGWTSGGWVAIAMPSLTNNVYKADGVSIAQTTEGTNTTFSINGFGDESNKGVVVKNNGALEYWPIEAGGGLEQDDTEKSVKFTLEGWDSPSCETSIAAMLTSNKTDRATHKVLCRRETDGGVEMHYAEIGDLSGFASSVKADGVTIATNDLGAVGIANFADAANGAVLQAVKKDESYGVTWVVPTNGVAVSTSEGVKTGKYLKFDTVGVGEGYFDLPSAYVEGDHIVATFSVATVEYVRDVTFEDGALTAHYGVLEIPVMYCSTNSHTRTVFQTVNHSDL